MTPTFFAHRESPTFPGDGWRSRRSAAARTSSSIPAADAGGTGTRVGRTTCPAFNQQTFSSCSIAAARSSCSRAGCSSSCARAPKRWRYCTSAAFRCTWKRRAPRLRSTTNSPPIRRSEDSSTRRVSGQAHTTSLEPERSMIAVPDVRLAVPRDATSIAQLSRDSIEHGLSWKWTEPRVLRAIASETVNVAVVHEHGQLLAFGAMEYGDETAHLALLGV